MARISSMIGLAVAVSIAAPAPADACTYRIGLDVAEPADGASDVPTDVVPWLYGQLGGTTPRVGVPASEGFVSEVWIALLDETGAMVDVDVVALPHGSRRYDSVEVRPRAPLAPVTGYTLRVHGGDGVTMHPFTTGEGPIESEPTGLGDLTIQVADNAYMSSCGDNTFACVEYARETTVHATVRQAGIVTAEHLWLWPTSFRYHQEQSSSDTPFCIELRARNLAGQLGPPSEICSDGVPAFPVATTSPITCDGARITIDGAYVDDGSAVPPAPDAGPTADAGASSTASDAGCSIGGRAGGSLPAWIVLLVLSGLARGRGAACRRRWARWNRARG